MKKVRFTHSDVEKMVLDILQQLVIEEYKPDYVVGITRGGLNPANLISQFLNIPLETLKVQISSGGECEVNAWMPEDAFGYVPLDDREIYKCRWDVSRRKNILIVDDINDTGATFEWIKKDWSSSCLPSSDGWDTVWHHNVRFATLINNESSNFKNVDFYSKSVNKADDPTWFVFPWEDWWK